MAYQLDVFFENGTSTRTTSIAPHPQSSRILDSRSAGLRSRVANRSPTALPVVHRRSDTARLTTFHLRGKVYSRATTRLRASSP